MNFFRKYNHPQDVIPHVEKQLSSIRQMKAHANSSGKNVVTLSAGEDNLKECIENLNKAFSLETSSTLRI